MNRYAMDTVTCPISPVLDTTLCNLAEAKKIDANIFVSTWRENAQLGGFYASVAPGEPSSPFDLLEPLIWNFQWVPVPAEASLDTIWREFFQNCAFPHVRLCPWGGERRWRGQ